MSDKSHSQPPTHEIGEVNDDHIIEQIDLEDDDNPDFDDIDSHSDMNEHTEGEDDDEMDASEIAPERDDSTTTFEGHKEPVFCVRFNPVNSALIATGGQDDTAFVWNTETGQVVFQCTGHKDTVHEIAFSHDGTLLATADMTGLIQVWHLTTKESIWSFEIADLEWLGWHYGTKVLFASDVEGNVWMWKIPSGDCKTFSNAGVSASTCCLLPDGSSLAVGYSNGVIKLWDLVSGTCKFTISGNDAHNAEITCLDVLQNSDSTNSIMVSGCYDGTVHLYNFKNGKFLKSFDCKENTSAEVDDDDSCSVEAIAFCSSRPLVAATTTSGSIFIFDIKSQSTIHKISNNQVAVIRAQWYIDSPLLITADAQAVVGLWDGRTGECLAKYTGHTGVIHDLDVSKKGLVFASASEDSTAKIYAITKQLDDVSM